MERVKKCAKIWLCIAIVLMLLGSAVASVIQSDGGKVTIKELEWETDNGIKLSSFLYVPENATAETPAPAIVTSHGAFNNKEMQDANLIELARRGYVVLASDQPQHGNSDLLTAAQFALLYGELQRAVLPVLRAGSRGAGYTGSLHDLPRED